MAEVAEEVAGDGTAVWHLAAARDLADLGIKVDADRAAINALACRPPTTSTGLEQRVDVGFAKMRGKLDQTAAGNGSSTCSSS